MSPLRNRIDNFSQAPDFDSFFAGFVKKPPRKIKKGGTIFYQGDETNRLFYLKKGFVKLFQTAEDGHEPVVYLYGPKSILGLRALTSKDHTFWHTCEALTDCELIPVSAEEYKEALVSQPESIVDLLYLFIQRLNYTERRLYGFITAETTSRVAAFLYDCVLRFGEKKNGKVAIPIPLTHQLVAEFVGSARESVTIALNKLIKNGVIAHTRGNISVLNLSKLKKQAGAS
jgi:CRP-like cAMP-binding protein